MNAPVVTLEPKALKEARDTLEAVCDHLVRACDQLGEFIAAEHGGGATTIDSVMDAFRTLWTLRWELGLTGGEVEGADPDERARVAGRGCAASTAPRENVPTHNKEECDADE